MKKKIVLAYSGGLDTSVLLKLIQQRLKANIITVTLDVGQQIDLKAIEKKAKKLGVLKHYSIFAQEEFVKNYVASAIKANAKYQGKYPLSTALSRPLIAQKLVEIAKKEKADAIAHGCTGKGNDQVRIEVSVKALHPNIEIIAPIREWNITRDVEIQFAKKNKIPIPVKIEKPYSTDQNIWGRSIECGILENPEKEPPEDVFEWTNSPQKAPDKPEYFTICFEKGIPAKINNEKMNLIELIKFLNQIAGKHGIGRIDHIEDRLIGIKSREIYECPSAILIIEAHKDLEKLILTKHELSFKEQVESRWTDLVYNGLWMDPLRNALEAFIEKTQERVYGETKIKLFKGHIQIIGRSSPYSLYDLKLATYNANTTFNQTSSTGFIELWGLQTKIAGIQKKRIEKNV